METLEPFNIIYQTAEDGLGDTCLLYTSAPSHTINSRWVVCDLFSRDTAIGVYDPAISKNILQ